MWGPEDILNKRSDKRLKIHSKNSSHVNQSEFTTKHIKMKEVIVHPTPELHTSIHEVPIPEPGPDEAVIKVIVAGSNPKGLLLPRSIYHDSSNSQIDWDHLTSMNVSLNSGDDIAGVVHSLGSNVQGTNEFKIGDRVAAFHPMMAPHGAFAEYAVAPQHTVLKIPEGTSFEGERNSFHSNNRLSLIGSCANIGEQKPQQSLSSQQQLPSLSSAANIFHLLGHLIQAPPRFPS